MAFTIKVNGNTHSADVSVPLACPGPDPRPNLLASETIASLSDHAVVGLPAMAI